MEVALLIWNCDPASGIGDVAYVPSKYERRKKRYEKNPEKNDGQLHHLSLRVRSKEGSLALSKYCSNNPYVKVLGLIPLDGAVHETLPASYSELQSRP